MVYLPPNNPYLTLHTQKSLTYPYFARGNEYKLLQLLEKGLKFAILNAIFRYFIQPRRKLVLQQEKKQFPNLHNLSSESGGSFITHMYPVYKTDNKQHIPQEHIHPK